MAKQVRLSAKTRTNWLIDLAVFVGAVAASLTGVFFLYLPSGGYQGGRNPLYGVKILFDRHTWDALHTWGGVLMIVGAAVHFAIHWGWVKVMARRVLNMARGKGVGLSSGSKFNLAVDAVVGVSFLLAAWSGIYFLFTPSAGRTTAFIFDRTTWDIIHTWSGVVMIVAAVVHFVIHWRWVKNVTVKFFRTLVPAFRR